MCRDFLTFYEQAETPGLGDKIESRRSDWVFQFDGRSIGNPDVSGWAITGDGGEFDQITGATISPRAIVGAVKDGLEFYRDHRQEIVK